jgi:hypothetical protein
MKNKGQAQTKNIMIACHIGISTSDFLNQKWTHNQLSYLFFSGWVVLFID